MAAISSTTGVTAAPPRKASKNPKEPSRGVDLDVIAVASVASGPSGLVQKVVADDGPGQGSCPPIARNRWFLSTDSPHPRTTVVRLPLPSAHRDTRVRPSKS